MMKKRYRRFIYSDELQCTTIFNVYEWIDNKNVKNEIVDFINTVQPNILCLQEFYALNELPNIQLPYQHIGLQSQKKQWRMATYSSFPIINKGTVSIKGERKNNICIYSDIVNENDTIRSVQHSFSI